MLVVLEMIGSVIAIDNDKAFNAVEIKAEMTGHYLREPSVSSTRTRHGKHGPGASPLRFILLK